MTIILSYEAVHHPRDTQPGPPTTNPLFPYVSFRDYRDGEPKKLCNQGTPDVHTFEVEVEVEVKVEVEASDERPRLMAF